MAFFNKSPYAIFIKKNSLTFFIDGNEKQLELPADIVSDDSITDPDKYKKLIEDFILAQNIKKSKVILILSEEVIFSKSVPITDANMVNEKLADFAGMIPVESEKVIKKNVKLKDVVELFAVNRELFEKIIEILKKFNFEVTAVVPLAVYSSDNELTQDLIKKIYKDTRLLKNTNFLNDNSADDNAGQSKTVMLVLIFLLVIIFVLSGLLAASYLKIPLPGFKGEVKLTKVALKVSPSAVSTESAAPQTSTQSATLDKDQLKVTVLNGTDIDGQAGKVKNLLIELGLSKIETGNAEGAGAKDTVVIFSPAVAEDLQEDIITLLEKNFDNVSTQQNNASSSADVLITTGKPKESSGSNP